MHINKLTYRFLTKSWDKEQNITFDELARCSLAIASILQKKQQLIHERLLVATESGIPFLVVLMACFFTGVVAICCTT
ncbi:AMP-binding protein [Photorhabdus laumondii subsp. laumondii]|uniref:AMP-binding protein n=1 Tax=Photorhabdus laumondii subsp. laumondii TaxID=141679 RepID=A0A6L9JUA2_PHOLM|nr:AMP-binding protein [Photorhabdus laumondii subsp. laumondii]NDL23067.1 AMP-binding protein [Photorhabdus laumondii subsp. laumondii]NDL31989.1 AMP-binding protein [Photorhabdus laumondii subsp. laumondii]NDL36612.1 AMP-binding protein [Photorhabdus laumondii subsp. laumondii]NDL41220.1 AMP-binding protein [Photorhabdus laumondii subsp. laumondii]